MTELPQVLLAHHLKVLKLPTVLHEYEKTARQWWLIPLSQGDLNMVCLIRNDTRARRTPHAPASYWDIIGRANPRKGTLALRRAPPRPQEDSDRNAPRQLARSPDQRAKSRFGRQGSR